MKLPDWLILWVWQSLIGEIYPEIRAVVLGFDKRKNLLVRYYLDREPVELDYENIKYVVTNILAHTSCDNEILDVKEEILFSDANLGELDVLNGLVYARKEEV